MSVSQRLQVFWRCFEQGPTVDWGSAREHLTRLLSIQGVQPSMKSSRSYVKTNSILKPRIQTDTT